MTGMCRWCAWPSGAPTASWCRSSSTRPSSLRPRILVPIRAPGSPTSPSLRPRTSRSSGTPASRRCTRRALRPASCRRARRWPASRTASARTSSAASPPSSASCSRNAGRTLRSSARRTFSSCGWSRRWRATSTSACKVIGSRTVRERDGLAMSSRNVYLSPEERQTATVLYRAMKDSAGRIRPAKRSRPRWRAAPRRSRRPALRSTISRPAMPRRWHRSPRARTARCGSWSRPSSAAPG